MAAEKGFFRTSAGWVVELDLPLNDNMQDQATRRQLTRVANAAGDPYVEPSGEPADEVPKRPADSALKPEWVGYALAVDPGLTVDQADAMTKNDLIEKYSGK